MNDTNPLLLRFDDFYLDCQRQRLTYRDEPVSLTPKAFQTLLLLVQNRGNVVEKDHFLSELWPDTFVEESTLAQNILTLRKALRRYRQDIDFIATVPRRGYEFVADVEIINPDSTAALDEVITTPALNSSSEPLPSRNLGQTIPSAPRRPVRWFAQAGMAVLVLLVAVVGYLAFLPRRGSLAETQFNEFRIDQIVADADIRDSVISPDGKYLALIQIKNGVQSLYVRQTENGNTTELVRQITGKFIGAAFSPVGSEIYYAVDQDPESPDGSRSALYKVSALGGASTEILRNIASPPAVSPAGDRFAFTRRKSGSYNAASLIITDVDGRNERTLTAPSDDNEFTNNAPSWSPDGELLSVTTTRQSSAEPRAYVAVLDAHSGRQKALIDESWTWAGDTIWLKDGSGVFVVAFGAASPSLNDELWVVPYPSGKSRLVTKGINGSYGISLNAATNSVVAVQSNKFACFLTASVDDLYKNTHVLTTVSDRLSLPPGADWTNDGRIVYSSAEAGNADIFSISEGGEQKQLTSGPAAEISPKLSADGRLLVFMSNRNGQMDVWRSDANGTNALQLTDNGNVTDSIISPDAAWVYYLVQEPASKGQRLWRVSINGNNAAQVTHHPTSSPRVSPDGRTVAAYMANPETNTMMLGLISTETGAVLRYLRPPTHDDIPFLDWSRDGKDLFVVATQGKPTSLWRVPLDGRNHTRLREWENDAIFRLAVSRDGQRIFYEVGNELNSVVQIQNLDSES